MNPRSEPLLWLQLIGLGVLPLQALLLLLMLAGSDPGRLPGLERLFTWAIGALLPGLLLLRRPADPFSLLLVGTPLRARRDLQRRLATLQGALPTKIGLGVGIAGALGLLVWSDEHAALAAALSPLSSSPRLVGLLLAALLLALMVWQWQQAIQALWLLSRPGAAVAAATPMPTADIGDQRLCLGLPLLLPDPLQLPEPPAAPFAPVPTPSEADASPEAPIEPPETESAPVPAPEEDVDVDVDVDLEAAGDDAADSIAAPRLEVVAEAEEVPEEVAEAGTEVAESDAAVEVEDNGEVAADVEVVVKVENDSEPPA